jgi:tRNA threonylcarbamoyladenosine biosynthesis protein TsaE
MNVDLRDAGATQALGGALGASLPSALGPDGAVVYLRGDLGAGKTTCVRGLLRTLGVAGLVRSPTYTLAETYELQSLTCIHVDLYRLAALSEVEELGLRDLLGPRCLLLVEWPEKGATVLPAADVDVALLYAGDGRQARLVSHSALGIGWLKNLGLDAR